MRVGSHVAQSTVVQWLEWNRWGLGVEGDANLQLSLGVSKPLVRISQQVPKSLVVVFQALNLQVLRRGNDRDRPVSMMT